MSKYYLLLLMTVYTLAGCGGSSTSHKVETAYLTNSGSNTLSVITNNTVVATVNVGAAPQGVAVAP